MIFKGISSEVTSRGLASGISSSTTSPSLTSNDAFAGLPFTRHFPSSIRFAMNDLDLLSRKETKTLSSLIPLSLDLIINLSIIPFQILRLVQALQPSLQPFLLVVVLLNVFVLL